MNIDVIKNVISVNDTIELIGSNANDLIKYKTDYDFQEIVGSNFNKTRMLSNFQNMIKSLQKLDDVYIVDFKAGTYRNETVRWSKIEILDGYKYVDLNIINFVDCLIDGRKSKIRFNRICR